MSNNHSLTRLDVSNNFIASIDEVIGGQYVIFRPICVFVFDPQRAGGGQLPDFRVRSEDWNWASLRNQLSWTVAVGADRYNVEIYFRGIFTYLVRAMTLILSEFEK